MKPENGEKKSTVDFFSKLSTDEKVKEQIKQYDDKEPTYDEDYIGQILCDELLEERSDNNASGSKP